MAMKTGTDIDIPISESGSLTKATVFKLRHSWTIENFTFYLEDNILRSGTFCAKGFDGIEWYIELFPQGIIEKQDPQISLYLILEKCDRSDIRVAFTLSILNSRLENIKARQCLRPHLIKQVGSWGWEDFVERDCVLKHMAEPETDKLTVRCEMVVLMDSVIVPSGIPLTRTDVGEPAARIPSITSECPRKDDPDGKPSGPYNNQNRISGNDGSEILRFHVNDSCSWNPFLGASIRRKEKFDTEYV